MTFLKLKLKEENTFVYIRSDSVIAVSPEVRRPGTVLTVSTGQDVVLAHSVEETMELIKTVETTVIVSHK